MDNCESSRMLSKDPKNGIILNELLDDSRDCSSPLCVRISEQLLDVVNSTTKRRLGKLDPYTMQEYLRSKQVPSVSLLTALIFIEKFVSTESAPQLLEEMTAVDLFTVSLMLASKYLYDVDCDHGAYNAEWATAFGMDLHDLNNLEIRFLSALNWCCFVRSVDLEAIYRSTTLTPAMRPCEYDTRRSVRLTRFRRQMRAHCGRRKHVVTKVLALLAATYVTYMNVNTHLGAIPFIATSRKAELTTNLTQPLRLPPAASLSLRGDAPINLSYSVPEALSVWPKLSAGDHDARMSITHLYQSPPSVPNLPQPFMSTVACGG